MDPHMACELQSYISITLWLHSLLYNFFRKFSFRKGGGNSNPDEVTPKFAELLNTCQPWKIHGFWAEGCRKTPLISQNTTYLHTSKMRKIVDWLFPSG